MKFIEISMPQNAGYLRLPANVLLNIDGILEAYVIALGPKERDERGHEYALFITHQSRQMRLHGTKSQCEQGYRDLRTLLHQAISDPEIIGIVGTITFPVSSED